MRYFPAILVAFLCAAALPAQAEKRIALVIGNGAYESTAELSNPKNDAADMSAALQRLGFEVVEGRDLDKRAMERVIRQFGIKLSGADVALFYYAGHGLQVGGQNYLVPTDARMASEGDVDFEGLPLSLVLKQMEREAKTSLILLDACRDNPLARNLARTMGTRSAQIGQGLAEVRTGVGTLLGFSTQPGNVSLDGTGRNSPYTRALLTHMATPDKDVSAVLVAVRNDVLKATGGKQVPWEHTSLTGQVYLKAGAAAASAPSTAGAPPSGADKDYEILFWNSVKDSKSPAMLETYLERYPVGTFAGLARVLIGQLRAEGAKAAGPSQPSQMAGLPPATPGAPPTGSVGSDPQALARGLQKELKRVGCDPGAADGIWGSHAREALAEFSRHAKVSIPTHEPTVAALDAVTARKDRVCPLQCDRGETVVGGRCVTRATERGSPKAQREAPRARGERSKEVGSPSQGMCWAQGDGRSFSLVPCSDPRAGGRAN